MVFSLNFSFPHLMAVAAGEANPASLSEAELAAHYPVVGVATVLLIGVGLVCDAYLVFRLSRRQRPFADDAAQPLLRVEPKPWTIQDLLFATGVLILALAVANSLLALGLKFAHVEEAHTAPWSITLDMSLYIAGLLAMGAFFRRRGAGWRQAVGIHRESAPEALTLGAILFFAMLPPLILVFVLYDKLCRVVGVADTPQPVVDLFINSDSRVVVGLIVAFAVAVAPVCEEFFFRGLAYPALKQRWGTWKALVVVSAAFALAHLHVPSLGPLFVLALALGLAYEWTGSLLAPITMHTLFNAANAAMLLYVRAHS